MVIKVVEEGLRLHYESSFSSHLPPPEHSYEKLLIKKFQSQSGKIFFGPTQLLDCIVILDSERESSVIQGVFSAADTDSDCCGGGSVCAPYSDCNVFFYFRKSHFVLALITVFPCFFLYLFHNITCE